MEATGIVCEYNPLHLGHKKQLDAVRSLDPDGFIVCLMSGNFVQRGDVLMDDADEVVVDLLRDLQGLHLGGQGRGVLAGSSLEGIVLHRAVVGGGNGVAIIAIILWGSAVASAFVDNIPFAATMIPVIRSLSAAEGIDLDVLAWTLSMGTDIGGNATPIGASANVVGTSIAAKNGHPISWGRYCRSMAPATVLVVMISMIVLIGRYV